MSDYKLTIYADPKKLTGHFSVGISGPGMNEKVYGRYARNEFMLPFDAAADVRDDSDRVKTERVFKHEIPLTKDQAEKGADFISKSRQNPGSYQLGDRNCVDFVQDTIKATGKSERIDEILPTKMLDEMGYAPYGAGDDAQRKGRILDLQEKDPSSIENDYTGPQSENDPTDGPGENPEQAGMPEDPLADGDGNADAGFAGAETEGLRAKVTSFGLAEEAGRGMRGGEAADIGDARDLLLKPTDTLTEAEVMELGREYWRLPANDPARVAFDEKRRDFYSLSYGDEPAEFDAVGRMRDPALKRDVPKTATPLATPTGEGLDAAAGRVADMLTTHADGFGETAAVKALQNGINLLADAAKERRHPPLRIDGDFGPRTGGALKGMLAAQGAKAAADALALGRVQRFATAERARGNPASGLKSLLDDAVEPLVAVPAKDGTRASTLAGRAMQETLNDLGAHTDDTSDATPGANRVRGTDKGFTGFEPLAVDGDVGSKTEDAFRTVNAFEGPDRLTRRFAENFGLV